MYIQCTQTIKTKRSGKNATKLHHILCAAAHSQFLVTLRRGLHLEAGQVYDTLRSLIALTLVVVQVLVFEYEPQLAPLAAEARAIALLVEPALTVAVTQVLA